MSATSTLIYSAYNPPPAGDSYIDTGDETFTDQSFVEDCDINHIIKKYDPSTGYCDPFIIRTARPQYGDFSDDLHGDFMYAQNLNLYAMAMFDNLPSEVRMKYNNDPEQFLAAYDADPSSFDCYLKIATASSTASVASATEGTSPGTGAKS